MHSNTLDRLMAIGGWTAPEQLRFLMAQARILPDRSAIVEVGVWQGRSALAMGEACRGTNKRVYGIDPWRDYETRKGPLRDRLEEFGVPSIESVYKTFLANRAMLDLERWVEPMRTDSLTAAARWTKGPCGLVFIDGDHSFEAVLADLHAWLPWTAEGGLVCGDDWEMPTVQQAVTAFLAARPTLKLDLPCPNTWAFRS